MAWLLYSYVLHLSKVLLNANFLKSASSYLCSILSAGRPQKWVLQKGAAESHVDPDPQGAAESRVEPDLSGQGTAESRRGVAPAPVPTDESNGDPVEVPAINQFSDVWVLESDMVKVENVRSCKL